MARTIVVTGAAGGINAAVAARLRRQGHRVIGADLRSVEIEADLATALGRTVLAEEVNRLAPHGVDGVVAGAGVSHAADAGAVTSVNFFGAVATIEGLRPALVRSKTPRALAVVSTASLLPASAGTVAACLAGDEDRAGACARASPETAYMSSKFALAAWIRRTAIEPRWAGAGIALNGVSPGGVHTAMFTPVLEKTPDIITRTTPKATPAYGQPEDLAEVIAALVTLETGYLVGQIVSVDGGTHAILRPDYI